MPRSHEVTQFSAPTGVRDRQIQPWSVAAPEREKPSDLACSGTQVQLSLPDPYAGEEGGAVDRLGGRGPHRVLGYRVSGWGGRQRSRDSAPVGSSRGRWVSFHMPLRISCPGRLQLDHPPGGVVHLRYRQAEPVPQVPEPFAAGPGDRLLQLPPVEEISRAVGRARRGCPIRCGQVTWAFLIWWGRIPVHCSLLGGLAGLCPAACLVSEADELSGAEIAASPTVAGGGGVHHA